MNKILISGEWRETLKTFEVKNPYTGEKIADVGMAGPDAIQAHQDDFAAIHIDAAVLIAQEIHPRLVQTI